MFKYCRNCGKPVSSVSPKCGHCNIKPDTQNNFCPDCGKSTFGIEGVCPNCKAYLAGSFVKSKSKTVTALLAIFFGSLGVHKFYLGFFKEGLYLLIFSFVLSRINPYLGFIIYIFVFIEATLYFKMSDKDFQRIYVREKRKWL